MRFLITLFSLLLAFSAFAADEKNKDTPTIVRGDHKIGVPGTPDHGYNLYFSEDKQAQLNFGGYGRLMSEYTIDDDRKSNSNKKFFLERLRFYVNAQKNKEWSLHTRFDYRPNSFATTGSTNVGTAGIYVARAYLTWAPSDIFSMDFGRILNQIYRFDVMAQPDIIVGNGIMPKLKFGNTTITAVANFQTDEVPANVNANPEQGTTLGSRIGHTWKLVGEYSIAAGFMGATEVEKTHGAEKASHLMPDIMLTGPSDFYILDQGLKKTYSRHTGTIYENYTEIGMGFMNKYFPDINYTLTKTGALKTQHTIAPEFIIKHNLQVTTFWTVIFEDYLAKTAAEKKISFKAYLEFYF